MSQTLQWADAYPDIAQLPEKNVQMYLWFYTANQDYFAKEVTEKMDRGWLRPFLLLYDTLLYGRWIYWLSILGKGTIEGAGPIPQVPFQTFSPGIDIGRKMLTKLATFSYDSARNLVDWLLWGFGDSIITERPKLDPKEERFFYENFDLMVLLANPTDYFSYYATEHLRQDGVAGYFPTPFQICQLMVEMQVADFAAPGQPVMPTSKKVQDPCVGAGAMLLPASNYFLRLYGTDINPLMVNLCRLHMWLYAPWGATGDSAVSWGDEAVSAVVGDQGHTRLVYAANEKDTRPRKYRNVDSSFLNLDLETDSNIVTQGAKDG